MKKTGTTPNQVNKALSKLGNDLKEARIKRRLTMELVAARAGITRSTLSKAEKGDASVSIGIYAKILFVLGLVENLYNLADANADEVGRILESENLPTRVRYKKEQ
jgi:transcriptional regulator with XRE-family HTH domain